MTIHSRSTESSEVTLDTDLLPRDGALANSLTIPLEVHIFQHHNTSYAFDVRSFCILKLDRLGAAVLSRMAETPLSEIMRELENDFSGPAIMAQYLRFLDLVSDGTLSVEPVKRPDRPFFSHLVVMLAGGCNMGCSYCFEKDVPIYQKPNLMSEEKADEVLRWFFRHQEGPSAHIQLYGGEPLLNWSVLQRVVKQAESMAAAKGVALSKYLITNGTLLNPDRVSFLKDHSVTVQVSVDGDEKTHDQFRVLKSGKPTMALIRPNIQELEEQGAEYNLRAVLTRAQLDPRVVIKGLRSLGASHVSFEVVASNCSSAELSSDDWQEFNKIYGDYLEDTYPTWQDVPDEMKSVILNLCQRRRIFYGCGAGISEVTVAPDGNIYECQRIYREPYSNIDQDWSPRALNSRFLTNVDDRPVCQDCWARYLCGGGCMHQAHVGHGSDEPLPQYCEMKRSLVESSIVHINGLRTRLTKD